MIHLKRVLNFIVRFVHQSVYSQKRQLLYNIFISQFKVTNQISSAYYWSSTSNASNTNNAWNVNFNNGNANDNNKTNSNNVRCVRAGE